MYLKLLCFIPKQAKILSEKGHLLHGGKEDLDLHLYTLVRKLIVGSEYFIHSKPLIQNFKISEDNPTENHVIKFWNKYESIKYPSID